MINVGGFYFKGGERRVVRGSGPIKCGIIKLEHTLPVISVILILMSGRVLVMIYWLVGWRDGSPVYSVVWRWQIVSLCSLTADKCDSTFPTNLVRTFVIRQRSSSDRSDTGERSQEYEKNWPGSCSRKGRNGRPRTVSWSSCWCCWSRPWPGQPAGRQSNWEMPTIASEIMKFYPKWCWDSARVGDDDTLITDHWWSCRISVTNCQIILSPDPPLQR